MLWIRAHRFTDWSSFMFRIDIDMHKSDDKKTNKQQQQQQQKQQQQKTKVIIPTSLCYFACHDSSVLHRVETSTWKSHFIFLFILVGCDLWSWLFLWNFFVLIPKGWRALASKIFEMLAGSRVHVHMTLPPESFECWKKHALMYTWLCLLNLSNVGRSTRSCTLDSSSWIFRILEGARAHVHFTLPPESFECWKEHAFIYTWLCPLNLLNVGRSTRSCTLDSASWIFRMLEGACANHVHLNLPQE